MDNTQNHPNSLSRTNSRFLGISEESWFSFLKRENSKPRYNSILSNRTSSTSFNHLNKLDPTAVPTLLEKYTKASIFYRCETFSQSADLFLGKIASELKIPIEVRVRLPLYEILVSISKVFMLNELEITVFACALDRSSWTNDDTLTPEDGKRLKDFPFRLGLGLDNESKKAIVYLLLMAFSLKQALAEKGELDLIQAYCEEICENFRDLYNTWQRKTLFFNRFSIPIQEVNRKFAFLSKREIDELGSTIKDYNRMVDDILVLGEIMPKPKPKAKPKSNPKEKEKHLDKSEDRSKDSENLEKTEVIHNILNFSPLELPPKELSVRSLDFPIINTPALNDFDPDLFFRMPSVFSNFSRNASINQLMHFVSNRSYNLQNFEDESRKKIKTEITMPARLQRSNSQLNQLNLIRKNSVTPSDTHFPIGTSFMHEDNLELNLPIMMKNLSEDHPSNLS